MKSLIRTIIIAAVGTAVLFGTPNPSSAQEKEKEKGKEKAPEKADDKAKKSGGSITGTAVAVDKAAKTVKLSGKAARVIQITATTKINKGGNPATLDDLKEGDEVSGGYKTTADGKLEATTLNIGPKAPAKGKDKKDEKKDDKK